MDSWRAASMKAQVLTTTRSASSGEAAATKPSPVNVPTNLSESTWFFGQPKVSIQYRSATGQSTGVGGQWLPAPEPVQSRLDAVSTGPDADGHRPWGPDAARAPRIRGPSDERRGRDLNPRTQLPRSTH